MEVREAATQRCAGTVQSAHGYPGRDEFGGERAFSPRPYRGVPAHCSYAAKTAEGPAAGFPPRDLVRLLFRRGLLRRLSLLVLVLDDLLGPATHLGRRFRATSGRSGVLHARGWRILVVRVCR